jgi:hypothetical protein
MQFRGDKIKIGKLSPFLVGAQIDNAICHTTLHISLLVIHQYLRGEDSNIFKLF